MGMAASQVRFLQLTNRKNDIGFQLTQLANDKVSLARDMQKVSKEYQNALNQKVLKWSNNSGVTYVDLSYQNLMKPSSMNQNTPYLLTDANERVVIDSEYQKYAAMISPTGAAGGDWESVRTQVLSEITGIDANKINNANSYQEEIWANEAVINRLIDTEPVKPTRQTNAETFIKNLDSKVAATFSDGDSWSSAYSKGGTISLGNSSAAATTLETLLNNVAKTLGAYLDDPENLQEACNTFLTAQKGIIQDPTSTGNKQSLESKQTPLGGNSDGFTINVKQMLDTIMGSYAQLNGHVDRGGYGNDYLYTWNDIDSATYQSWSEKHATWQTSYDAAKADYDNSVKANNQLFTADEESLIKFYDAIFSSIAEKGWTYNNQVNDTEYLNQMLQNNLFMMTTVDRDTEFDENSGEHIWDNDYTTDIASNFTNIFTVNDSDAREDALVEYEHKKSIINEKESRIDTRMKNLETEQAAINQMLQGLEQVENDNIDRTMSWSA